MSNALPVDAIPAVGDLVAGKFRVVGILGEGGMGVVLDAIHEQLRTPVAIKLLRGFTKNPVVLARFLREARAAAGLQSDHVVKVFDVGALDSGAPFMVLERLTGEDLSEVLTRAGPQSVADTADYVLQACEGLAEAHAMGIVHRDLKPANLFRVMRKDGSRVVKILDFGISKDTSAVDGSLTATAQAMGSPYYMSPEQVRSAKDVDLRTDIWALGIIIHELLTQKAPFGGDTLGSVFAAIVADVPESVRVSRADVPQGLEHVIGRCLEKQVARRYANIGELARDLAPFAPRGAEALRRILQLIPGASPSVDALAATASHPDLRAPSTAAFPPAPPTAPMRASIDETGVPSEAVPAVATGSPAARDASAQATGGAWGATRPSNESVTASSRRLAVAMAAVGVVSLALAAAAWVGLRTPAPTAAAPPIAATAGAAAAQPTLTARSETTSPPAPTAPSGTPTASSSVSPPSPSEPAPKPASSAPASAKTARSRSAPRTPAGTSRKNPSNEAYDDRQ